MLLELAERDGLKSKRKTANEYASSCPGCGGTDRFIIHTDTSRYWCRGCGKSGDALQYLRDFHGMSFPDAAALVGKILSPNRQRGPAPAKNLGSFLKPEKIQSAEWLVKVDRFIEWAHGKLMKNNEVLDWLHLERGITRETAERFRLGWLDHNVFQPKKDWGMSDGNKFFIPSGLSIPWQGRRVRIRRDDPGEYGRYFILKGSDTDPFLIGDPYETTAIVVESELDAILLSQEITRPVFIVAMGSTSNRPDADLIEKLTSCPVVLIAMDTDGPGGKAAKWWADNVPGVFRTLTPAAIGSDITEAFIAGLDLNEWLSVSLEIYCETITKTDEADEDKQPDTEGLF